MNKKERLEVVRAMDTIAKTLNDERDYVWWAAMGIPDGEIDNNTKDEDIEWLCEDDIFPDLLFNFCRIFGMKKEKAKGFLYCDGIVGKETDME